MKSFHQVLDFHTPPVNGGSDDAGPPDVPSTGFGSGGHPLVMGPPPPPADADALAAHAAAIRRLARSLVADDATADDVAQETMRVGLEHPPRAGFPPFAWLAGIARNVARGLRRTDRRRLARETAAARPDRAPATADAVARLEVRRRVVDAVLALAEPYRATLALRFFDGLPPRAIARRHGVPVETVRTRCKRGLELLRAELDRRHGGDRRAWMVAVAPLALGGAGLGSGIAAGLASVVGGSLVTTSSKVGVAALAALLLVGGVWLGVRGTQGPAADVPPAAPGAVTADGAPSALTALRATPKEGGRAGPTAPRRRRARPRRWPGPTGRSRPTSATRSRCASP
jgi:RNA polymerase sigma factor (sigma-70 family)